MIIFFFFISFSYLLFISFLISVERAWVVALRHSKHSAWGLTFRCPRKQKLSPLLPASWESRMHGRRRWTCNTLCININFRFSAYYNGSSKKMDKKSMQLRINFLIYSFNALWLHEVNIYTGMWIKQSMEYVITKWLVHVVITWRWWHG